MEKVKDSPFYVHNDPLVILTLVTGHASHELYAGFMSYKSLLCTLKVSGQAAATVLCAYRRFRYMIHAGVALFYFKSNLHDKDKHNEEELGVLYYNEPLMANSVDIRMFLASI